MCWAVHEAMARGRGSNKICREGSRTSAGRRTGRFSCHFFTIAGDGPSLQAKHGAVKSGSEEEGELLCDTLFSLAYGALLLLSHTTLRLFRGRRYGILGANGSGKSTLMRQLRDGKVENFPPQDQVRCVMVEHSLQGEDTSLSVLDFVASGRLLAANAFLKFIDSLNQTNRSRMYQSRRSGANFLRLASMMLGRPTSSADFQGVGK